VCHSTFSSKSPSEAQISIACAILIILGALRIVSTYAIFSPTNDERTNIGSGMEWLTEGSYNGDPTNPPLARVLIALGPFLERNVLNQRSDVGAGVPTGQPGMTAHRRVQIADLSGENIIFGADNERLRNLSLARLGVLPFFVVASVTVYLLATQTISASAGFFAVLLFTTLPPVLAHAGLATSDFAEAAAMILAVFAFVGWLTSPTLVRSIALGAAAAIALVAKFSAILFLSVCFLVLLLWFVFVRLSFRTSDEIRLTARLFGTLYACLAMSLVIWACYRFSVGPILIPGLIAPEHQDRYARWLESHLVSTLLATPVPAPEFFRGIAFQYAHNARGHIGYLFGHVRQLGWWYFFPVVLAVKTPLPSLFLAVAGCIGLLQRSWRDRKWQLAVAPLCCIGLLASVLPSHINIGLRYILPIYGFVASAAGYGVILLGRAFRNRLAATAMVTIFCGWQVVSSLIWHPDYLAYFNEAANFSRNPIVIDSDLDWGQDLFRLSEVLRDRKVAKVSVALMGFQNCPGQRHDQANYDLPETTNLLPNDPRPGWVAVSYYVLYELEGYSWLRQYEPVARVGKSILLYSLDDNDIRRAVRDQTRGTESPEDQTKKDHLLVTDPEFEISIRCLSEYDLNRDNLNPDRPGGR
jgi:4-amino-4-deoxy-L-arabinose transferase-like glycosyltransferase